MKAKKITFVVSILLISGCMTTTTFVQTARVEWSTIQIREGLDYDHAWGEVLDVVTKRFEMEMISKDGGYARIGWIYTWLMNGQYTDNYRVRVIFKFSPDGRNVDLKTEAEKLVSKTWITGYDTRLLQTIKTDIMGVVGRTTM
nr:hypothetical protein [Bacteroidota bacterium]